AAGLHLDVGVRVVAEELRPAADPGRLLHRLKLIREVVVGPGQPVERDAARLDLGRTECVPDGADRTRRIEADGTCRAAPEERPPVHARFELIHPFLLHESTTRFDVVAPCQFDGVDNSGRARATARPYHYADETSRMRNGGARAGCRARPAGTRTRRRGSSATRRAASRRWR